MTTSRLPEKITEKAVKVTFPSKFSPGNLIKAAHPRKLPHTQTTKNRGRLLPIWSLRVAAKIES